MGSNNSNENKPIQNIKEEKLKKVPTKEIKPKEEVESNFKYL
jgi:hypothetical protein